MPKVNVGMFLNLIPLIMAGVQSAQAIPGASGAEKKKHALDLVRLGLTGVQTVSGKHVLDIPETQLAVSNGIDAVVAMTKAVEKAKAEDDGAEPAADDNDGTN